ncbi:helix-turn-helix transcriptional regulator [Saccharomonospora cyanea]|uniref:helix-turn-helix transcriptional regulator n=1 Tax=Saccharomonospora cyanea TaxID=40989 RepID=UPI0003162E36|nr:helix-turn-helix transcriptional regulator [Saccharomonospora cyanea]
MYETLIRHPNAGLVELGFWLGWSQRRLSEALSELQHRELIESGWKGQRGPVLVDPSVALPRLVEAGELALQRYSDDLDQARTLATTLIERHRQALSEPADFPIRQVVGHAAVRDVGERLAASCDAEVLTTVPGAMSASADGEEDRRLLDRGIRVRKLCLRSATNDSATSEHLRRLVGAGGQVRTVPSLPVRMSIYDRAVAVVAVEPRRSRDEVVVVRGTAILTALCALFDGEWGRAPELDAPSSRDDDGLTDLEHEVLRLLGDGHTDAVVARKMGVSVRTIRRVIAELAERLGARSRFQIGARAVEAGWLSGGG